MLIRNKDNQSVLMLPLRQWIRLSAFLYPVVKFSSEVIPPPENLTISVGPRLVSCEHPSFVGIWNKALYDAHKDDAHGLPMDLTTTDYSFLLDGLEEGAFKILVQHLNPEPEPHVILQRPIGAEESELWSLRINCIHSRSAPVKRPAKQKTHMMTVDEVRTVFEEQYADHDLSRYTIKENGTDAYKVGMVNFAWKAFLKAHELMGRVIVEPPITVESTNTFLTSLASQLSLADRIINVSEEGGGPHLSVPAPELVSLASSLKEAVRRLTHHVNDSKLFEGFQK